MEIASIFSGFDAAAGFTSLRESNRDDTAQRQKTVLALQRTVGNTGVQRLLEAPEEAVVDTQRSPMARVSQSSVQRSPDGKKSGQRQATITVRWSEDDVDFFHNVVNAVSRQLGIERELLFQPMHDPAIEFHRDHDPNPKFREGDRIHVQVSLVHSNPGKWESAVGSVTLSDPPSAAPAAQPAPQKAKHQPQPGETDDQRLSRQTEMSVEIMSGLTAEADNYGYSGITFVIAYTGKEIEPRHMEKLGPQKQLQAGTGRITTGIAEKSIRNAVGLLVQGGPGEMAIEFNRDGRGVMHYQKWERRALPPTPKGGSYKPRTEREMLDEYGIPDPQKQWAEIHAKWVAELKDAAIMVGTFALTEIVTWIIAGALLKIAGKILFRLPNLYRLIRASRGKAIEDGLAKLAKGEVEEFGRLLKAGDSGATLDAAQTARVEELAQKLENVLAPAVVEEKVVIDFAKPLSASGYKSTLQQAGSEFGVFEAKIPGVPEPVAVKVYPQGHPVFARDIAGAEAASRTGFGPKFYGEVEAGAGKQAFAMERVSGALPDAAGGAGAAATKEAAEAAASVSKQTLQDLRTYGQKLLDEGYFYDGEVQGLVDKSGRWRPIDFQPIKRLPSTAAQTEYQEAVREHWENIKGELDLLQDYLNRPKP
jgi:hypothetical protein